MSLMIIIAHVKDGMEMAREYGLPPSIKQFIQTHHGTTVVEYFFEAAKKQAAKTREETVRKDQTDPADYEFRYPGPKPRTKEAAILLLCDGVEPAVRAMTEATPIRIEQRVHAIASKRLEDGQFDQANITLRELRQIEESISKTLSAIYHARVKYPNQPGQGTAAQQKRPPEAAPANPGSGTLPPSIEPPSHQGQPPADTPGEPPAAAS
jgi:membrane-associated HD superfamily phosphohydrolase